MMSIYQVLILARPQVIILYHHQIRSIYFSFSTLKDFKAFLDISKINEILFPHYYVEKLKLGNMSYVISHKTLTEMNVSSIIICHEKGILVSYETFVEEDSIFAIILTVWSLLC